MYENRAVIQNDPRSDTVYLSVAIARNQLEAGMRSQLVKSIGELVMTEIWKLPSK